MKMKTKISQAIFFVPIIFLLITNCDNKLSHVDQTKDYLKLGNNYWAFKEKNKFGIKDHNNNIIKVAKYDTIESFEKGIARVKENDKWGLIDTTGKTIIPTIYDAISKIKNGFVIVARRIENKPFDDWKFAIIKENGEMFTEFIYDSPRFFSEGLLAHKIIFEDEKWRDWLYEKYGQTGLSMYKPKELWGFIDKNGKVIINYKYGQMKIGDSYESHEGIIAINKNQNFNGLLDFTLNFGRYDRFPVSDFVNGRAKVLNYKWGIIDKNGRTIINYRFDEINSLVEDSYAVKLNNKWGFIDSVGKLFIKPQFEEVKDFSEGLAAVRYKSKWGYINKNGMKVTPFKYDNAEEFKDDFGIVLYGSDTLYVTKDGKEKVKLQ